MKRIVKIEGMHCEHCKNTVEKALEALPGMKAKVNLGKGQATVETEFVVSDGQIREAVEGTGFKVVSIEEKRGLFGF